VREKTRLFVVRHGLTMFNKIGRAQGWSDTPLTLEGEQVIRELGVGLAAKNQQFKAAVTSDSGRTMLSLDIILKELAYPKIPHYKDKRIREWCFGSFDGDYNSVLFDGVLPRTDAYKDVDSEKLTYETLAKGLLEVDTTGWAEPWEMIKKRIWMGFEDIAHSVFNQGGGNALVISHSITIRTLCSLIDGNEQIRHGLKNGSVTLVDYDENTGLRLQKFGSMRYSELGKEIISKKL